MMISKLVWNIRAWAGNSEGQLKRAVASLDSDKLEIVKAQILAKQSVNQVRLKIAQRTRSVASTLQKLELKEWRYKYLLNKVDKLMPQEPREASRNSLGKNVQKDSQNDDTVAISSRVSAWSDSDASSEKGSELRYANRQLECYCTSAAHDVLHEPAQSSATQPARNSRASIRSETYASVNDVWPLSAVACASEPAGMKEEWKSGAELVNQGIYTYVVKIARPAASNDSPCVPTQKTRAITARVIALHPAVGGDTGDMDLAPISQTDEHETSKAFSTSVVPKGIVKRRIAAFNSKFSLAPPLPGSANAMQV